MAISKVAIVPHNDDETLWLSYTIQRERPLVIVVYDSYVQVACGDPSCDRVSRIVETKNALYEMDPEIVVTFCGLRDDTVYSLPKVSEAILHSLPVSGWETITDIWAPAYELGGHDQHNLVAQACSGLANHRYTTYTRGNGKTRTVHPVPYTPDMIARKHRALACYTSQIANPSTQSWFTGDIEEYYGN